MAKLKDALRRGTKLEVLPIGQRESYPKGTSLTKLLPKSPAPTSSSPPSNSAPRLQSISPRRMLPESHQNHPQIHRFNPVHFQALDSGTPCRGESEYLGACFVPDKMFVPDLSAGVEKWHNLSRQWVQSRLFGVLVGIAGWAREGEISQVIAALFASCQNVFYGKGGGGVSLLIFAVFAVAIRPFKNLPANW